MNADSALSFSATGYQLAEIASEDCEAPRDILLLLDGNAAKVRYCPCCWVATHVVISVIAAWGELRALKAQGVELWRATWLQMPIWGAVRTDLLLP